MTHYFEKLADLGFMVICRRNPLGTTTMFAVKASELEPGGIVADDLTVGGWRSARGLPEWRVVDFADDDAAGGARMLYEKLTLQGIYAHWDERMAKFGIHDRMIGRVHRPDSELFEPVADE